MAIKFTDLPQLSGTPADTDVVAIVDVSEDVSKKITVADLVSASGLDAASVRSIIEGSDLDMGSNKVLFSNMYATEADLPNATSYHGMFAHVHATGAAYFAHGGSWVKLANLTDVTTSIATAKSEAISTAAADATTKADQAEADARAYADQVVAATVDAAPAALDTLNELAAALGDDANFASTVTASIAAKADDAATTAALATKATQSALDALSASMVSSVSPVFTGSVSANNFAEGVNALSGTSASIDPSNGSLITHTLTGGTTYTYAEGWGSGESVTLHIESAGNTVTWPSTKWVGGSVPDLSSTAGTHLINLCKVGSDVYGTYVGLAVSGPGAPTLILISAYRASTDFNVAPTNARTVNFGALSNEGLVAHNDVLTVTIDGTAYTRTAAREVNTSADFFIELQELTSGGTRLDSIGTFSKTGGELVFTYLDASAVIGSGANTIANGGEGGGALPTLTYSGSGTLSAVTGTYTANIGGVYAFDHSDLSAAPIKLQPAGENSFFGASVAVNETYAVIGAWGDSTGGQVYVYDVTDLTAAPTVLEPSDIGAGDRFGASVAVSSNFIVVGSQLDNTDEGPNSGSVYVYNANNLSEAPTKLVPFALSDNDYFGETVACSDDYIAVGAPQDDDNGSASGSVFVWPASEMSSGNTIGGSASYTKLTPSDGASSDQFGTAMVISGTTLVVGSFHAASGMAGAGAAYVYDLTNLGSAPTKLMAESAGRTHYARFGATLAMDGDTLVIGSWGQNVTGSDNSMGAAYVYDASNLGALPTKLIASDGAGGHRFGNTVAVKGNNIVVGASHIAVGATSSAGAAYVYDASDLTAAPVKIDAGSEAEQSAEFGNGIAIL